MNPFWLFAKCLIAEVVKIGGRRLIIDLTGVNVLAAAKCHETGKAVFEFLVVQHRVQVLPLGVAFMLARDNPVFAEIKSLPEVRGNVLKTLC